MYSAVVDNFLGFCVHPPAVAHATNDFPVPRAFLEPGDTVE